MLDMKSIPAHVAIIMDGNGRWAEEKSLPKLFGHNAGMKAMKEIVRRASALGMGYLTVYAFSTENWKRSEEEVSGIFKLLVKYVDKELDELNQNHVKVTILGDCSLIPSQARERIEKAVSSTADNDGLNFNIALNYGSRDEITRAVCKIGEMVAKKEIRPCDITEDMISDLLYTGEAKIPDPDLLIRTSGEKRLSNYLLWQLAYSEFVFTDTYWPDFSPAEFEKAIEEYQKRDRRFGGRRK